MASAGVQPFTWPRDDFEFTLLQRKGDGGYSVEAVSRRVGVGLTPRVASDLSFNLSGVLGNNNGKFHWGTSFFEKTVKGEPCLEREHQPAPRGQPVSEGQPSVGYILKADLLDLSGKPPQEQAQINLHDKLELREYRLGENTYHRLTERDDVRVTENDDARTPRRTLVLCFDGTSNHFSEKNTNVVKLVELLKKDDPERQMVYYQTGVGTYSPLGFKTATAQALTSVIDQGVAVFLYQHVIDGYRFLMQTYRAGDKIALFGFSRGAFTARALAGMLHCVGLLPAHNIEHVAFAYDVYKQVRKGEEDPNKRKQKAADRRAKKNQLENISAAEWLDPSEVEPEDFKKTFSVPVIIDFVGVWDTVASVGALRMREFRWIEYNPSVLIFRQALALDEHRGNFIPSLWDHRLTNPGMQDAREVWFRGEHCDVGGGSAGPKEDIPGRIGKDGRWIEPELDHSMLSNISLRWMVRQLLQFNTGILLDLVAVRDYQVKGILETPLVNGMAPELGKAGPLPEQFSNELDRKDIEKPLYDSIGHLRPLWNLLEYLGFTQKPLKVMSPARNKNENDRLISATTRCPNSKAGRSIYFATKQSAEPDPKYNGPKYPESRYPIYIHSSVVNYMRMQLEDYTPRATWYGFDEDEWPRIEFTPRTANEPLTNGFTNEASVYQFLKHPQARLNKVSKPGKDKQLLWREYRALWRKPIAIGTCAALATAWFIFIRPTW